MVSVLIGTCNLLGHRSPKFPFFLQSLPLISRKSHFTMVSRLLPWKSDTVWEVAENESTKLTERESKEMNGNYWKIQPRMFSLCLLLAMVPCTLIVCQMVGGLLDRLPTVAVKIHEGLDWIADQAIADQVIEDHPSQGQTDRTCLGFKR